ncbi:unnamed protein product [Effrenium voratum]|nr:unnamed protein product [Effrenium voratum]
MFWTKGEVFTCWICQPGLMARRLRRVAGLLLLGLPLAFLAGSTSPGRPGLASKEQVARPYWQSQGEKPEEETVEGTVVPGAMLGALALYLSVYPATNGVTPEFLVSVMIIGILGIVANTMSLAANMNLPTWIDFQIQKQKRQQKAKDSPWPWQ